MIDTQKKETNLDGLATQLVGDLFTDHTLRSLYATDASAYRELPLAVAIPAHDDDIETLINFARENGVPLIPRTAGTSLAGQVVGSGIVVDVSRTFNRIYEVNEQKSWVRLQPGVVRDELNMFLAEKGFFFGPETSTANRAMIGGMIGNNSCGSNSVVYGSTREHLLEVTGYLADGSKVTFGNLTRTELETKLQLDTLEGKIYREMVDMLSREEVREKITQNFPKPSIKRRNTGYALDRLMENDYFGESDQPFNFCKLIAGSEGTLLFITEIKLHVNPLPPRFKSLVCIHFHTIHESLKGNLIALKYNPSACELMDHYILDCTKNNREYRNYRFFVEGDPQAILVVEISRDSAEKVAEDARKMIEEFKATGLGYHFPLVSGDEIKKVWSLRKAGLGLLSNIPGDAKPVPVIEDTAVDVHDLPDYIEEFNLILKKHDLFCVHYAHAGSGELHLRPIIDLKTKEGNELFRTIATEIAHLVKKYRGSLSGEHGDGRLRGEFIPFMVGEEVYSLMKKVKEIWDKDGIFNPGKIVDTPSMNSSLRFDPGQPTRDFETTLDFSEYNGILRTAELCNGSGDCRKTHLSGGTMCPSYMATRDEKDTTRARANILREILTQSEKENPFDSEEIKEVMDLCLSCKGCKSECPSNVDVGKLKAEWQHQYYKANGIPFRNRLIASFSQGNKLASIWPGAFNFLVGNPVTGGIFKGITGFASKRSIPNLHRTTLKGWYCKSREKNFGESPLKDQNRKVYLFCDEFTNYNDVPAGIKAVKLLTALGYQVEMIDHEESGRTYLSKGMLDQAKKIAKKNVATFAGKISEESPLLGVEPSCIYTFVDEYIDLLSGEEKENARDIAKHTLLIDEFITSEFEKGRIDRSYFIEDEVLIKLHGHCHQKAISSVVPSKKMLMIPQKYRVELIPSGCCGMAGSFGYEKEHFDISMKIGELVLFPTIRKLSPEVLIAAPGTSCRHQIKDGTRREAKHPVEILYDALKR